MKNVNILKIMVIKETLLYLTFQILYQYFNFKNIEL